MGRGFASAFALVSVLVVLGALPSGASALYVDKAKCQPGDQVETALQGQIPQADRISGRAAQGYICNLKIIGKLQTRGWISLDTYGDCAYFSDTQGSADTGTLAVDVSDPTHPTKTAYLTEKGMGNTWESMKVNHPRGLLAAGHDQINTLSVYDVRTDCRHPRLLFNGDMPTGVGHEGTFSPDGRTYYMTAYGSHVSPIDLDDPTHPVELAECDDPFCQIHGGSISEDGTRGYFAQVNSPDGLAVVDTTEIQARKKPGPEIKSISTLPFEWNAANQATIPVFYGSKPYLVSFGELTKNAMAADSQVGTPHCPTQLETNFDFPRILDITDERKPKIVSKLMNEVQNPINCPQVIGDNSGPGPDALQNDNPQTKLLLAALFAYDSHYCSVDRTHDPTLLGCGQSLSGIRLYDIRDPVKPKEIAYYNPGTMGLGDGTVDGVGARPIIRSDLGQVWMVSLQRGFRALQFENGVWPFPDTPRCPSGYDPYLAHYDLTYERDCGYAAAAKTPEPGAPVVRIRTRGLTLRARRVVPRHRASHFLVTGRLLLPRGISPQTCRGGDVVVSLRSGGRRLARRRTQLTDRCTYAMRFRLRRLGRDQAARGLVAAARFRGTNRLAAVSARPRAVRRR